MPISPQELDWMRRYAGGAPPDQLRAEIPGMYGEPSAADMAALGGPDPRLAQNMSSQPAMSSMDAPPAPPPVASDASGMSGGMSVAPSAAPSISEGTMSAVSPEQLQAMGAGAEQRLAASEAPAPQPGPAQEPQSPVDAFYQRAGLEAYRGSRGGTVPGGEQLAGRTVSRELHGALSPETSDELDYARRGMEGLAVEGGEKSATGLEAVAANQRQQAQAARTQLASYTRTNAAKQAEYDIRQSELDDMRADVEKNPVTYFSGKDTFTKILNVIGLAIMGLDKENGSKMILPIIEGEIARKQKERGTSISLLQDRLNRFKEGIPNPESQAMYSRSLGLDAAAAETESMANQTKAEDARQRGFMLAAQLRQQALEARAAGETGLIGKEEVKTANVPTKYTGGKVGGLAAVAKLAKETGHTTDEVLAAMASGKMTTGAGGPQNELEVGKAKHERELFVRLPDGSGAYATTSAQKKELQDTFNTSSELLSAYGHLKKIHQQVGPSAQWNREALGDAEATVARIQELLREKGVKLNENTMKILQPLSGAGIKDWVIGPGLDAAINRATQIREAQTQQAREQLSASPWTDRPITKHLGGAGSTFKAEE